MSTTKRMTRRSSANGVDEAVFPQRIRHHGAEGEHRFGRVTGEHIGPRHSPVGQQAGPGRLPLLDLRGVLWSVGNEQAVRFFLVPTEGRHVPVVAKQYPGLHGSGLRRQVALPPDEPMAVGFNQASHRRCLAGLHRLLEHFATEPVDLDEQDPRGLGVFRRVPVLHDSSHRGLTPHVIVDPQQRADDQVDGGQ
ncbi:MAG: hypothetical protein ACR2QK_20865 [Acidimicrobiales bacterium]